jgi:hypothetical protein
MRVGGMKCSRGWIPTGWFMTVFTCPLLSRLESGSLPGHRWQLIRPASNLQPSRFDPHPPSRPLVLRYVWSF